MKFGDKNRFSIELNIDENHGGAWLFGRFCYWIAGEMVGEFEMGTSLRDVLFQMKYIVNPQVDRFCCGLFEVSKEKAFEVISEALDENNDEIYEYVSRDFTVANFDICIPVDIFNNWKIFLIDGYDSSRVLYSKMESMKIKELLFNSGEFNEVVKNAYLYLNSLYESEIRI
ncbi:Imm42 family immunity protein [Comamonas odontotermitis]|uniref:Imm42 family immunity protein n=1 Tax=Comamonas odontotermitis TaxID=379895 RepID=UPI00366D8772